MSRLFERVRIKRFFTFARRVWREVLRDPLNLCFGLGFPVVLLLLLTAIQRNIPVSMFELSALTPGISVFGLSFFSLFSALLIAKDRKSALLTRLYTTPLTAADFILGYTLPLLPLAMGQGVICYAVALLLGLPLTGGIFYAICSLLPAAMLFIALGLLCGSVLSDKQAGGICGALLTNLSAWFSGIWFDMSLVGKGFSSFANLLPFVHAVNFGKGALSGAFLWKELLWVLGYAAVLTVAAICCFVRQSREK